MKKIIILSLALILGFTSQMEAQNEDYKSNASFGIGYSLTGSLLTAASDLSGELTTITATPVLQLTYDYALTNWFSVGVAGSLQNFEFNVPEYSFTNADNEFVTEAIKVDYNRTTIAFRPLFHYGGSEKLDMYSGLRVQLINNSLKVKDTSDEAATTEDIVGIESASRVGVGIVAFGIRYFFTDNIGAGFELTWGAPYIGAFSVNARF